MMTLRDHAMEWLKTLPEVSTTLWPRRISTDKQKLGTAVSESSPLARFYAREISTGQKLLGRVRRDLQELVKVCDGDIKQTNESRALLSDLNHGMYSAVHPQHGADYQARYLRIGKSSRCRAEPRLKLSSRASKPDLLSWNASEARPVSTALGLEASSSLRRILPQLAKRLHTPKVGLWSSWSCTWRWRIPTTRVTVSVVCRF